MSDPVSTLPSAGATGQATARAPMLSTQEALARLLAAAQPVGAETVDTLVAHGRVLAESITAPHDVPRCDASAMDGYAVRAADWAPGRAFPVSQRIAAGQAGEPLEPGTAARIFTGAPVPPGADAVIMQEDAQVEGGVVRFAAASAPGAAMIRAGSDIAAHSVVVAAGARLTPQALGLVASVGAACVRVTRRLRVAVFFTGDELVMPGEPLRPGAIYNSNRFVLRALLANLGCEVTDLGIVPDRLDATRDALRLAARGHDVVLTSGGVSVGEEDHVKAAVEAEGRLALWKIAIKPGKPLAFGALRSEGGGHTHFIGLPGNPVSGFVTFAVLVRPFLLKLAGVADIMPRALAVRADFSQDKAEPRNEFLRASINPRGGLDLFPHQGSAVLTSTARSDGLIDTPPGHRITEGEIVRFLPFSDLLY
jgi:molybdopterin molybdotransferase